MAPTPPTQTPRTAATTHTAADAMAEQYWTKYFKPVGDYGKQWVKDIPRRVKAECARLAGVAEADVLSFPVAHRHISGARFVVEGTARVLTASGPSDRLWKAELNLADSTVGVMELQ